MGPFAGLDGHDFSLLVDELVPSLTAEGDDLVIGLEDPVGQPIVAQELPDVLDRVQFGRFWRQEHERDVFGNHKLLGGVPAGLIEEDDAMGARRHLG